MATQYTNNDMLIKVSLRVAASWEKPNSGVTVHKLQYVIQNTPFLSQYTHKHINRYCSLGLTND